LDRRDSRRHYLAIYLHNIWRSKQRQSSYARVFITSVNKALGEWRRSIPAGAVSFRRLGGQAKVGLQVKKDSSVVSHSHIDGVYIKTEGCNRRVLPEVG